MKASLFTVFLLGLAILAGQRASAGSAVAIGVKPRGHSAIVSNPAYTEEVAKQKALALWHTKWRGEPRILASTGVVGECAVATWSNGRAWAIGVALGKRSESEADSVAIKYCLQHCPPGAQPKIVRAWRGG